MFGCTFFLLCINDLYNYLIFDIAIYADDNTLCSESSDLPGSVGSGLLISVQFVSFNCSINPGDINSKMKGIPLKTFGSWVCP